ncbi:MAG: zf-HC2 domain-containing protein [Planctomycetes bacterium]|nr:zf-HC2 domain-containing protein [Planctomycetota bacterium]
MTCDLQKDKLSGYFDGELDERERAEVERHIAGCSDCLRELGELKAAVAQLRGLPRVAAPPSVRVAVDREVAPERRRRPRWFHLSIAAAAALMLTVSLFSILGHEQRVSQEPGATLAHRNAAESPRARLRRQEDSRFDAAPGPPAPPEPSKLDDEDRARDSEWGVDAAPAEKNRAEPTPKESQDPTNEDLPFVLAVASTDLKMARTETETVLATFGVKAVTGAAELGNRALIKDHYLSVDLTEAQIAILQEHLARHKATVTRHSLELEREAWSRGKLGAALDGTPLATASGRAQGAGRKPTDDDASELKKGASDEMAKKESENPLEHAPPAPALEEGAKPEPPSSEPSPRRVRVIMRFVEVPAPEPAEEK